jgi:hypothetical protein
MREMGDAGHLLDHYLRMTRQPRSPRDPMQQAQLAMLEQWLKHLEFILHDERIPADVVRRVIKSFIYGCTPNAGEAELRDNIMAQHIEHLQSCTPSPVWLEKQFPEFGVPGA